MPSVYERPIWRIDSSSVRSSIRDVAKKVDAEGNKNGKVSHAEVEAFIARRNDAARGTDAFEDRGAADTLYMYMSEAQMPLPLDVLMVAVRKPMTAFSDWLGKSIMGD